MLISCHLLQYTSSQRYISKLTTLNAYIHLHILQMLYVLIDTYFIPFSTFSWFHTISYRKIFVDSFRFKKSKYTLNSRYLLFPCIFQEGVLHKWSWNRVFNLSNLGLNTAQGNLQLVCFFINCSIFAWGILLIFFYIFS